MAGEEIFRVNYYVGAMLAQGGNLRLYESRIVFSPTSALDRAMGAQDVIIPFQKIRGVDNRGVLSRSFNIKTDDKVHRFEGGQAKKFWELLEKALPDKGVIAPLATQNKSVTMPVIPTINLTCDQCAKSLQPGYSFCPHCGARLKSTCSSCHRTADSHWRACAFCGWKFQSQPPIP